MRAASVCASPHRLFAPPPGHTATPPRWPITRGCLSPRSGPSFEPKTHRLGGALPQSARSFGPKTAIFRQKQSQNTLKTHKRRQAVAAFHVHLNCPLTKSLLLHSNSTMCPGNGPKMAKNGLNMRCLCQKSPKPRTGRILGYVAQNRIPRAPRHPQPPTFGGVQASESPNETPRPPYYWSLGGAGGQHSPRTVGANGGSIRVPGAQKIIFFKVVPRPLGMLKQVFLGRFEPVVSRFGPWKIPQCLENGPFQDQKGVKNGSKTHFSKSDPGPFGMLKRVFLAHFEPEVMRFGPWKIPKCFENGHLWDQKWVKNASKMCFSKSDLGPFGMLKQMFLAHFEPNLTKFGPFRHVCAPSCTLCTYLRAVWWSHLELGRGV